MNYYTDVLKKYTVFAGRAARKEYWMFALCTGIVTVILSIIDGLMHTRVLGDLYVLAVFLPTLALASRRLHDIGKSAWWLLILLIPLLGEIVILLFAISDSQPGDNQYGPNPKGATAMDHAMPTPSVPPSTPSTPQAPTNPTS